MCARGPSHEHETETMDQHNKDASSLAVSLRCRGRSRTNEIFFDGGHVVPDTNNHMRVFRHLGRGVLWTFVKHEPHRVKEGPQHQTVRQTT